MESIECKKNTLKSAYNRIVENIENNVYSADSIEFMYDNLIDFSNRTNAAGKDQKEKIMKRNIYLISPRVSSVVFRNCDADKDTYSILHTRYTKEDIQNRAYEFSFVDSDCSGISEYRAEFAKIQAAEEVFVVHYPTVYIDFIMLGAALALDKPIFCSDNVDCKNLVGITIKEISAEWEAADNPGEEE